METKTCKYQKLNIRNWKPRSGVMKRMVNLCNHLHLQARGILASFLHGSWIGVRYVHLLTAAFFLLCIFIFFSNEMLCMCHDKFNTCINGCGSKLVFFLLFSLLNLWLVASLLAYSSDRVWVEGQENSLLGTSCSPLRQCGSDMERSWSPSPGSSKTSTHR